MLVCALTNGRCPPVRTIFGMHAHAAPRAFATVAPTKQMAIETLTGRAADSAHIESADAGATPLAPTVLSAVDPATRAVIASVFATQPATVAARVAQAQVAGRAWGSLSFGQRTDALTQLRAQVARHAREIAETISGGMGKPLIEALSFEVSAVLDTLDDCIAHGADDLADEPVAMLFTLPALLGRYRSVLLPRSPRAVVCIIAPVSLPFERAMTAAVIALAAGNAVIVKPSSSAPLVGVLIERLFNAAFGHFPGLAQVVHGTGDLGSHLATSEGVDVVILTGSASVGRKLQHALAPLRRPALLDVGGADALIVCDDANLERAARAAVFSRFSNNGQSCAAVRRAYVQRAVADVFIDKVMHKVWALKRGPWTDPFCELGPLANGRELENLRALLQDALDRRAVLVAGGFPAHVTGPGNGERRGADRQGWYWPPTVITKVHHEMRVMQEPPSGPILPIQVVEDDQEAIGMANDTQYGFDASVFSGDPLRAKRIAAQLHAGAVAINDVLRLNTATPGLHLGAACHAGAGQRILVSADQNDREPHWFPYSAARLRATERALDERCRHA